VSVLAAKGPHASEFNYVIIPSLQSLKLVLRLTLKCYLIGAQNLTSHFEITKTAGVSDQTTQFVGSNRKTGKIMIRMITSSHHQVLFW
jgi:hypothetical protein